MSEECRCSSSVGQHSKMDWRNCQASPLYYFGTAHMLCLSLCRSIPFVSHSIHVRRRRWQAGKLAETSHRPVSGGAAWVHRRTSSLLSPSPPFAKYASVGMRQGRVPKAHFCFSTILCVGLSSSGPCSRQPSIHSPGPLLTLSGKPKTQWGKQSRREYIWQL